MLSDEKIERIKMLDRNGVNIPGISSEIGCDFKTVKKYLGIQDSHYIPQPESYPNPNYSRFRSERERKIGAEVDIIISERDEKDSAYGVPPQTAIERYEEKQILKSEITRKYDSEDSRRKREEEHKERMRSLEVLGMETKLQNQATQEPVTNTALLRLQQQLETQAEETRKLKELLTARKEKTLIDTIKRLENQITETPEKNHREWWEK